jgi:hypothetical protein
MELQSTTSRLQASNSQPSYSANSLQGGRRHSTSNPFQSQGNSFSSVILLLLLQLIQQLIQAIQNNDKPQTKPQQLDLSQESLDQLSNALNLGKLFIGGNAPKIVSAEDTNNDGILSPGDTAFTETFTGRIDNPVSRSSFTITQDLLDINSNLQAGIPALEFEQPSQFTTLNDLVGGNLQHVFDNDLSGSLSLGDEIVANDKIQIVDQALLDEFNASSNPAASVPLGFADLDFSLLLQAANIDTNTFGFIGYGDSNSDGLLSVGDRLFYDNLSDINAPPGTIIDQGFIGAEITEEIFQRYVSLVVANR